MNSPFKTYLWQFGKSILAVGSVIIYSRMLGSEGRGSVSVLLLYLQFGLMVTEVFTGSAMANWFTRLPWQKLLAWLWLFPVVVLGLGIGLGFWMHFAPLAVLGWLFLQGLGLASLNIQYNIYQSQNWINRRNQLQFLLEAIKLVTVLVASWFLRDLPVQVKVLWVLRIIAGVSIMVWLISLYRTKDIWKQALPIEKPPLNIFLEGIWAQLGQLVLFLLFRAPLWIVPIYFGMKEAGVIANAILIADFCWIYANSFGTVIHARVLQSDKKNYHDRLLARYMGMSLLGTLVLCAGIGLMPQAFYVGVFGPDFMHLKHYTLHLVPAIILLSVWSTIGHYLHAVNRFKRLFLNYFVGIVIFISVVLGLKMSNFLSVEGILWGVNFGYAGIFLVHFWAVEGLFKMPLDFGSNVLLFSRLLKKIGRK